MRIFKSYAFFILTLNQLIFGLIMPLSTVQAQEVDLNHTGGIQIPEKDIDALLGSFEDDPGYDEEKLKKICRLYFHLTNWEECPWYASKKKCVEVCVENLIERAEENKKDNSTPPKP